MKFLTWQQIVIITNDYIYSAVRKRVCQMRLTLDGTELNWSFIGYDRNARRPLKLHAWFIEL
jgi:hypothetical protein